MECGNIKLEYRNKEDFKKLMNSIEGLMALGDN